MLSRNIHVGKSSYILELVVSCSWLSSFSSSSIESTSQANQNMIGVYIGIDSVYYALCSVAAILVLIVFSPAAGFYINATLLAIQFWNSDKYIFGNFGKCSFISWYIGADSVWHGFGGKQQKIGRTTFYKKSQFSFFRERWWWLFSCAFKEMFYFWIYSIKGEYFQFVRILSSTKANFGEVLTHFSTGDSIKPLNENCI